MLGKKQTKPLVPAKYQGKFRCALPESGDEFTMYPLTVANWVNHPVSVFKDAGGVYVMRGCPAIVETILIDQRRLTGGIWVKFYLRKVINFLIENFGD